MLIRALSRGESLTATRLPALAHRTVSTITGIAVGSAGRFACGSCSFTALPYREENFTRKLQLSGCTATNGFVFSRMAGGGEKIRKPVYIFSGCKFNLALIQKPRGIHVLSFILLLPKYIFFQTTERSVRRDVTRRLPGRGGNGNGCRYWSVAGSKARRRGAFSGPSREAGGIPASRAPGRGFVRGPAVSAAGPPPFPSPFVFPQPRWRAEGRGWSPAGP